MKPLSIFYSGVVIAIGLLIIDQIWTGIVDHTTFWKIIITLVVVGGGVLAVQLIRNEMVEEKKNKDGGYVD